jgi:uncharacterized protein
MKNLNESSNPTVWVDADACPLKEEIIAIVKKFDLNLIFVASVQLKKLHNREGIETVLCEKGTDSADNYIEDHSKPGDIAVTTDLLFAKILLNKKVFVCGFLGSAFNLSNITEALGHRLAVKAHLDSGHITMPTEKCGNAFDAKGKSKFKNQFHNFLTHALKR